MTSSLRGLCLNASYKERGLKPLYIDYRNALIYLLDCFSTVCLIASLLFASLSFVSIELFVLLSNSLSCLKGEDKKLQGSFSSLFSYIRKASFYTRATIDCSCYTYIVPRT